jgi:hypothetical protein
MTIDLSRPTRKPTAAFCTVTRSPVAHAYHCGLPREKTASNSDLGVRTPSHMSKINKFPELSGSQLAVPHIVALDTSLLCGAVIITKNIRTVGLAYCVRTMNTVGREEWASPHGRDRRSDPATAGLPPPARLGGALCDPPFRGNFAVGSGARRLRLLPPAGGGHRFPSG